MVAFNLTGEDYSPLITYSPANAWLDSPSTNALVASSSDGTLHATTAQGASASVQFTGTGIWFLGSTGPTYGSWAISVDGEQVQTGTAQSDQFISSQVLGGVAGLSEGAHQAVLTSTGPALDLDSFIFEASEPGTEVTTNTVDDADSAISYTGDWTVNQNSLYMSNTLHFTQTGGATATYQFTGNAVAMYGTVSPDHANYTVTVDGQTHAYDGGSNSVGTLHAQSLLYYAGNLGPQQHTLVLTANPDQAGQSTTGKFMDLDAIMVYATSGSTGTDSIGTDSAGTDTTGTDTPGTDTTGTTAIVPALTTSGPAATSSLLTDTNNNNNNNNGGASAASSNATASASSPAHHAKSNMGLIIGVAVGAAIGILLLTLLIFFLLRRRSRNSKRGGPPSPTTPALPLQGPDMLEAGFGSGAAAQSAYENNEKLAPFSRPAPPPTFAPAVPMQPAPAVRDFSSHYHTRSLSRSVTSAAAPAHTRSVSNDSLSSSDSAHSGTGLLSRSGTQRGQAFPGKPLRAGSPAMPRAGGAGGLGRSLTGAPVRPTRPPTLAFNDDNALPPRPPSPRLVIDQSLGRVPARPSRPDSLALTPVEGRGGLAV